jgi:uncharacterized circularly permuted ATP-grasp superfamily protein
VFSHGFLDDQYVWKTLIDELTASDFETVTFDLPGFGERAEACGPFTYDRLAGDVAAVVDTVGKPFVIVGHSMSGPIVELVAASRPDAIGLILLAPAPMGGFQLPEEAIEQLRSLARAPATPACREVAFSGLFLGRVAIVRWRLAGDTVLMAPRGSQHASGRLLAALDEMDLRALSRSLSDDLRKRNVTFGAGDSGDVEAFVVDPVPRVIERDEWDALAIGLAQRTEALERFVADVYGERRIVAAERVPWSAIESAEFFERRMADLPPASGRWIAIAGLDLVRDGEGPFVVLEDNVRTPSGIAYALAAREALSEHLSVPAGMHVRSLEPAYEWLNESLRAAAPAEAGEHPTVVVLTDGPSNSAYYEHGAIAHRLGLPLVVPADLSARSGRLFAHTDDRTIPVDVVYRRTNEDRLFDAAGEPTTLGAVLLGPLEAQTLGCVNAFGTGVADDKLVHVYVEEMVRFYLEEEPLLASVPTLDLSQPGVLAMTLERIGELVIKPRGGSGGIGVVVGPRADAQELATVARELVAAPERFIVQETVRLSRQPTVCGGELELRHVDLRPFTFAVGDRVEVFPGGLTRVALERDSLVVNSSRRGGAKDTWVLA